MKDFTSSAYDGKSPWRAGRMFVASIAIFPSSPVTLLKAGEIWSPGTATRTKSAADRSSSDRGNLHFSLLLIERM
ncbi:hypothetical protein [Nonomuraea glycinis]|uniref:hypothetical protein n=1 Tax=Nonomuraea glycinis TaxID=2047744 RepID=UPI0033B91890